MIEGCNELCKGINNLLQNIKKQPIMETSSQDKFRFYIYLVYCY